MEGVSPAVLIKISNQVIIGTRHFLSRVPPPLNHRRIAPVASEEICIAARLTADFLRTFTLQNLHSVVWIIHSPGHKLKTSIIAIATITYADDVTALRSRHFLADLIGYFSSHKPNSRKVLRPFPCYFRKTGSILHLAVNHNCDPCKVLTFPVLFP